MYRCTQCVLTRSECSFHNRQNSVNHNWFIAVSRAGQHSGFMCRNPPSTPALASPDRPSTQVLHKPLCQWPSPFLSPPGLRRSQLRHDASPHCFSSLCHQRRNHFSGRCQNVVVHVFIFTCTCKKKVVSFHNILITFPQYFHNIFTIFPQYFHNILTMFYIFCIFRYFHHILTKFWQSAAGGP